MRPVTAIALLLAVCACTSSTSQPDQDTRLDDEAASAPDTNPDGLPYPTTNVGTSARSGSRAGNRIANYKFLGYPDADKSKGLQPVSLASYFDPEGKNYKLLHIQASGVWCTVCQKETEILVPLAPKLKEKKIVWLVSMAEGATPGTPSVQKDIDNWIQQFQSPFTHVLDPGNKNLGVFYDAAALPWQGSINARTMEILSSGTGGHTSEAAIWEDLDPWLEKIDNGTLE